MGNMQDKKPQTNKSLPVQVSMDIIEAMVFSQVHKHTCSTAPLSGPAEAAVTNASAWRTLPLLGKMINKQPHYYVHTFPFKSKQFCLQE